MEKIINKENRYIRNLPYLFIMLYPFIEVTFLYIGKTEGYVTFKIIYFLFIVSSMVMIKQNILVVRGKIFFAGLFSCAFMLYQVIVNMETISSDTVSFIIFIFFMIYASDKGFMERFRDSVICYQDKLVYWAFFYLFIILLSLVDGSGITNTWNIISVEGPYPINHDFAYSLCVLYCLYSFLYKQNARKIYLFLSVIFAILIILTGVRSATLAMIVLLLYDYKKIRIEKKVILIVTVIITILVLALTTDVLVNNPFVQKQKSAMATEDVTNGRTNIWKEDIRYYLEDATVREKVLGIGIGGIREVNFQAFETAIQAHNDFLNILIGYGIVGLAYVIYILGKLMKSISLYFIIFVMILALTNGFVMYSIIFSIAILCLFFNKECV